MVNKVYKASKPLDLETIDDRVLSELRKQPRLLKSLNDWVLFADRHLIRDIAALGKIVREIKPITEKVVYRGFGNWGSQENLGFKLSRVKAGDREKIIFNDRAISFTTDIEIARAFGYVVAKTEDYCALEHLYVCPELCVLISEMRNLKNIETQEEVIILPPINITCEIIEIKKKSLFSW